MSAARKEAIKTFTETLQKIHFGAFILTMDGEDPKTLSDCTRNPGIALAATGAVDAVPKAAKEFDVNMSDLLVVRHQPVSNKKTLPGHFNPTAFPPLGKQLRTLIGRPKLENLETTLQLAGILYYSGYENTDRISPGVLCINMACEDFDKKILEVNSKLADTLQAIEAKLVKKPVLLAAYKGECTSARLSA